jgi:RimJ/RimL family protein N-acetyltransferase
VLLATNRLLLRLPEPRDADAYTAVFSDPEVVRYTGGVISGRSEMPAAIDRMLAHWQNYGIGLLSVVRKEDERLLGRVGFLVWDEHWRNGLRSSPEGPLETEIGWTLAREFWGQGYATEAAVAARDWAIRERSLTRLISLIQTPNVASVRVAKKIGETLERENLDGPFAARTDLYSLAA